MTAEEIAKLIRFVHALCPAQKMDELTPDAWELVIGDIPFEDAKAALKILGKTLRFIAPADIAQEVRRVRNQRAAQYTDYENTLPDADPDRPLDYIAAMRAQIFRAASGDPELAPRPVQQAIETTFVRIESAWSRSLAPLRAIEPPPADPDFDNARAILGAIDPHQTQHWLNEARHRLEADGVPLDHRAVAILAANLATSGTPRTTGEST